MAHTIFNYSNICLTMWLDRKNIEGIIVLSDKSARIELKSGHIVNITADEVKPIMEEKRLNSSKDLIVNEIVNEVGSHYLVKNPDKNTEYQVEPMIDHINCNCKDYQDQSIVFESKKIHCKHVFAVLNYLGFSKLSEYESFVDDQLAEKLISQIEDNRAAAGLA